MLDYRAYKLYKLLWLIPYLFFWFIGLVVLPLFSLYISFVYASSAIAFVCYAFIALLLLEIFFQILAFGIVKVFNVIFFYLIDIVPTENRSQLEAKQIVFDGRLAELNIRLSEHPKNWSDADIEEYGDYDWLQRLFFNGQTKKRLYFLREIYLSNENKLFNQSTLDRLLLENDMSVGFWEKLLMNKTHRMIILRYLVAIIGVIYVLNTQSF